MVGGTQLVINQLILSPNKSFKLLMQPDGNLVVYQTKDMKVMWASNTMNSGAIVAKMQPDGNFVLYNANNSAKWASGTDRHPGAILSLLDSGYFVVYTSISNPEALWTSGTTAATTTSTSTSTLTTITSKSTATSTASTASPSGQRGVYVTFPNKVIFCKFLLLPSCLNYNRGSGQYFTSST